MPATRLKVCHRTKPRRRHAIRRLRRAKADLARYLREAAQRPPCEWIWASEAAYAR